MSLFAVSYDLNKQKDYPKLWDALKKAGAHRILESLWLGDWDSTPKKIVDWLSAFVDSDDSLFAAALDGKPHYKNAKSGTNDWLAKH